MDRRGFLKSSGAAAAMAATATTTAAATTPARQLAEGPAAPAVNTSPTREYTLALAWADTVAGPADLAHRLATRIREASGGRLRLILDYSNTSDAEFVHASEHTRAGLHPAFSYFAGLPADSGLDGRDLEAWISTGGGQDLWDRLSGEHGDKPLLAGHLGPAPVMWSNRALDAGSSLRGLRVAIDGPSRDLARALGAEPVAIPPSRLAAALASGEVDAVEHGATLNAMAIGLPGAASFAVTPPLAPAGTAIAMRVRRDVWEQLGQADQALFSACSAEVYRTSLSEARLAENLLLQTLLDRGGLEARAMPKEITAALPHLSEAIVANLSGHDAAARRINASYMLFRRHLGLNHPSKGMPVA
ncbi:MAG: twin-arginine translocation signal domain-containing protein [Alphaproteobacteria bacterium]|nr:twin-arginine translocation signal domain-containing protein [Alphaproteobacteria bacterium]